MVSKHPFGCAIVVGFIVAGLAFNALFSGDIHTPSDKPVPMDPSITSSAPPSLAKAENDFLENNPSPTEPEDNDGKRQSDLQNSLIRFKNTLAKKPAWGLVVSDAVVKDGALWVQVTSNYIEQNHSLRLELARSIVNVWNSANGGRGPDVYLVSPSGHIISGYGFSGITVDE